MNKKKILFIVPSLKAGGAERVISFLAKNLDQNIFKIKVAVVGFKKDAVYNLDDLDVTFFNQNRMLNGVIPLFKLIKIYKPEIVFGTIRHVNILLGFYNLIFKNVRFIVRDSSVMSVRHSISNSKQQIPDFLVKFLYNKLDAIVCQSNDIKNDLIYELGIKDSKLITINNPITQIKQLSISKNEYLGKLRFITIGRLSEEKGYERILIGLSKIKNYIYSYTIIGSGPLESHIKNLALKLNIYEKIKFIPYTSNVLNYLSKSDFFIQGSYVEGFPNAVLESCSVGTPVLAFDCPGGTKEIITNNLNGILVDSQEEFESVLRNINTNNTFNRIRINEYVNRKFSAKKIINQYEELFSQIE